MSSKNLILGSYAALAGLPLLASIIDLPVYVHMISATLFTIFIGCHLSLKSAGLLHDDDDLNSGNKQDAQEVMTTKDAWMFPVFGSVVLFSLYLVFKFFPKEIVNMLVKIYFYCVGLFALTASFMSFMDVALPKNLYQSLNATLVKIPIPHFIYSNLFDTPKDKSKVDESVTLTKLNVSCFIVAVICASVYLYTGNWILSNLFGVCFSIQGIALISIGSTKNGLIMLWGLLIYDVFWVFGTEVMVTVAKSFDAPIKLLFPKFGGGFSMLGLGDIVVPGIFMSLMLRFDYSRVKKSLNVARTYFWSVMLGYFAGLTMTVGVMYFFQAAQPALLYLVPTCSISVFVTAIYKKQALELFNYDETPKETKEESVEVTKKE